MKLGTLLVHLDPSPRCAVRVELAAALARSHGSHLIGLIPTGLYDSRIPARAVASTGAGFIDASANYLRERTDAIAQEFRRAMEALGPLPYEILTSNEPSADAVIRQGRTSDLILVGQSVGDDDTEGMTARDLPEQVMLQAGCPVLVVPNAWQPGVVGRHVLVAWDGSREAAVALRASLPLLAGADEVTLVALRSEDETADAFALQLPQALAWLQRHGIPSKAKQQAVATGFAEALLTHAARTNADLIVMGGYGHPRLRELVLGGVTRDMLARTSVPLLMAH